MLGQDRHIIKQIDDNIAVIKNVSFENETEKLTELYYQSKEVKYKKGEINTLLLLCDFYIYKKREYNKVVL